MFKIYRAGIVHQLRNKNLLERFSTFHDFNALMMLQRNAKHTQTYATKMINLN